MLCGVIKVRKVFMTPVLRDGEHQQMELGVIFQRLQYFLHQVQGQM